MRVKMRYLIVVVTVFSCVFTVSGLSSSQKKKTIEASRSVTAVPSYVSISASANPEGDSAQEKAHCFKVAPADALIFTVTSTDTKNHPLPENVMVTVKIINLRLLASARAAGLSKPDVSPSMKFEQSSGPITNGKATVVFKADSSIKRLNIIHLGPNDPMSTTKSGHYSNVALITISPAGKDASAGDPEMYVYPYELSQKPAKCGK
jgi:hypothetical protein